MKKFTPLNDRIVVKRTKEKDTTEGGIIIPETSKTKSKYGEVLAVGPGAWVEGETKRRPIDPGIKPGVVVYFRGVVGREVDIEGETYVVIREEDVEGIVEE